MNERPKSWFEIEKRCKALGFRYPTGGENIGTLVIDLLLELERLTPTEEERVATELLVKHLLAAHDRGQYVTTGNPTIEGDAAAILRKYVLREKT